MRFIPINSPEWDRLLLKENESQLYEYCAEYFEYVFKNHGRPTREMMPTVYERDLEDGIHEVVRIHFAWFTEWKVWHISDRFHLKRKEDFLNFYGKLHYLWTKDDDTISCIERRLLDKMIWETCHPDFSYNSLLQAKAMAFAYFKNPAVFDKLDEIRSREV